MCDYSDIGARAIIWLEGERWRQEVFGAATSTKPLPCRRSACRPRSTAEMRVCARRAIAELALGYGGSVGSLKAMGALEMGLSEDELPRLVETRRQSNPKIVSFW